MQILRKLPQLTAVAVVAFMAIIIVVTAIYAVVGPAEDNVVATLATESQVAQVSGAAGEQYSLAAFYMPKMIYPTHQWISNILYNRDATVKAEGRGRYPLLGYYSGASQTAMEYQIFWAIKHGVDTFIFDEYWGAPQVTPRINHSVNSFLSAKNNNFMHFAIYLVDSAVPGSTTVMQSLRTRLDSRIVPYWKDNYFNRDNYLRAGGKPVVYLNFRSLGSNSNFAEIKKTLDYAEKAAGEDIIWLLAASSLGSSLTPEQVKEAGFDGLAPYYIVPGSNSSYVDQSKYPVNPPNGTAYSEHISGVAEANGTWLDKAEAAGLYFVPSITSAFDVRNRDFVDPWVGSAHSNYTRLPNTPDGYETLLRSSKAKIDSRAQNNNTALLRVHGRPLITLGSYNEWIEGAAIEPGYSAFSQTNPFFMLQTIADVFNKPRPANETYPIMTYEEKVEAKTHWNFGVQQDIDEWALFEAVDADVEAVGRTGSVHVLGKSSFQMEARTYLPSFPAENEVTVRFRATCNNPVGGDKCTDSVQLTWYSTQFPDDADLPGSASYSNRANFRGVVTCPVTADNAFQTCTFDMLNPDPGTLSTTNTLNFPQIRGRLEMIRLTFNHNQGNSPVKYYIQDITIE